MADNRPLSLNDLDGRTKAAREARDLVNSLVSERGGDDQLDVVRRKAAESYAITTIAIEQTFASYLSGEPLNVNELGTLLNSRRREAEMLGGPAPRDISNVGGITAWARGRDAA